MTKMVITFLMETFIAFDDEDGYNVYLGNIHCLFMNAFPMVSFARTPGDQIESSHPVPTSEKITGQPLYCLHQHNSPSYRVMFQNFEWGNVVVIFYPCAAPLSCLSQQSQGSPGRIISHKKRPFWCQCPMLNGWVQAKIRRPQNGYSVSSYFCQETFVSLL